MKSEDQSYSIKNWAKADRPREKMLLKGRQALSDAELVAILIGSGNREDSAVELSKKMLNRFNNDLNELAKCSISQLQQFKGIGEAKAISIAAALEIGRRRQAAGVTERQAINFPSDAFELLNPIIGDLPYEELWVIFLNQNKKILTKTCLSSGGLSSTIIDVRLIMKKAIEVLASAIIVVHNHPSGQLAASEADIKNTKKIIAACKILDIHFSDHLIIANQQYFSFMEQGYLNK